MPEVHRPTPTALPVCQDLLRQFAEAIRLMADDPQAIVVFLRAAGRPGSGMRL